MVLDTNLCLWPLSPSTREQYRRMRAARTQFHKDTCPCKWLHLYTIHTVCTGTSKPILKPTTKMLRGCCASSTTPPRLVECVTHQTMTLKATCCTMATLWRHGSRAIHIYPQSLLELQVACGRNRPWQSGVTATIKVPSVESPDGLMALSSCSSASLCPRRYCCWRLGIGACPETQCHYELAAAPLEDGGPFR